MEGDLKLTTNNYKGIVRLEKTAYFVGERVKGQVVLGRYDDQLVPSKVTLGKKDITKKINILLYSFFSRIDLNLMNVLNIII